MEEEQEDLTKENKKEDAWKDLTKAQRWKTVLKNPKQGFRRIKKGIESLSPAQQLHGQIVGTKGTIIGFAFAWGMMLLQGMWWFSIIMFFAIWLNVISLTGLKQKYKVIIDIQNQIERNELMKKL